MDYDGPMLALLFASFCVVAAIIGGLLALKGQNRLNLTLGLTAGILLGLVAFNLLPEIFNISANQNLNVIWPMVAFTVGFLLFHTVEKLILVHDSHEKQYSTHSHPYVGIASSAALIVHSFLDGMSIGLAFSLSNAIGIAVAVAVIAHRFADGFSSVNLMMLSKNSHSQTMKVLTAVTLAPIFGVLASLLFTLPPSALAIYLAFFGGFVLYISASDILPQAHSQKTSRAPLAMTFLGVAVMCGVSFL